MPTHQSIKELLVDLNKLETADENEDVGFEVPASPLSSMNVHVVNSGLSGTSSVKYVQMIQGKVSRGSLTTSSTSNYSDVDETNEIYANNESAQCYVPVLRKTLSSDSISTGVSATFEDILGMSR